MTRAFSVLLWLSTSITIAAAAAVFPATTGAQEPRQRPGWTLPDDAASRKNPLSADEKTLAAGKTLFLEHCERCHGRAGLGDGPDAEPDAEFMNLTDPGRADLNPDGVVFYKVWNGRRRPRMPAFKEKLAEEQVWTLVAYVQSLRKNP